MKKLICLIISSLIFTTPVLAKSEILPSRVTFHDVIGINSIHDVKYASIVYYSEPNNLCADIELDDIKELLQIYWDYPYKLVLGPYNRMNDYNDFYINIWTDEKEKENNQNMIKHTMYANDLIYGAYGELTPYSSEVAYSYNFVWYKPITSDSENELKNVSQMIYNKYRQNTRITNNFDGNIVPYTGNNILPVSGCHEWALQYIQKAASYNILPYSITEKYQESITRDDFCNIAGQMIAVKMLDNKVNSDNLNDVYNQIKDNEQLQNQFDAAWYADLNVPNDCIRLLTSLGIVTGNNEHKFEAERNISREEAAAILGRIVRYFNIDALPSDKLFFDDEQISEWAKEDVYRMSRENIMVGRGNGEFCPQNSISVEESITAFTRLFERLNNM